jgi:dTDP-4-amino-4,6-dideoxygalactose transaminase
MPVGRNTIGELYLYGAKILLSRQKALAHLGYKEEDFPVAEAVCQRVLALPLYPEFPEAEQQLVIQAINEFFDSAETTESPSEERAVIVEGL